MSRAPARYRWCESIAARLAKARCRGVLDQLVISESMKRLLLAAAQPGSELQGRLVRGPARCIRSLLAGSGVAVQR